MIVQAIVFFVLGVAVTGLLLMLIGPLVWRRMLRQARKKVEKEFPVPLKEVETYRTFLRSEVTVTLAHLQKKYDILLEDYTIQKTEFDSNTRKLLRAKETITKLRTEAAIHKKSTETVVDKNHFNDIQDMVKTFERTHPSNRDLAKLRKKLMDFAVFMSVGVIRRDGQKSPVFSAIKNAEVDSGLAGRILKTLNAPNA